MEIQNASTTPCKSEQLQHVNTVRWESGNVTTQPLEINNRTSDVIAFVVNACMNVTANNFYIWIQERSFFDWSICYIKLKFCWIYIRNMFVKFRVIDCEYIVKLSRGIIKAYMNIDILLQTAAIFFSNELLSETGYWLGWCHFHGLPLAARSGSEIFKMTNSSCLQRDSNSRPLDCEAIALTARPRRPDTLSMCLNLTRFSLCFLNLHDNTWQSVFFVYSFIFTMVSYFSVESC